MCVKLYFRKKGGKGKDDDSDERNDTTCATQDHVGFSSLLYVHIGM